jgi:outer membrane immunogenic protein
MKKWLAAVMLTSLSSMAWANDSGLYVGAGVGKYNVELEETDLGTFEGDDTVLKVFAGYRINSFLALELDYIDLGETSDTLENINVNSEVNGFAPYVIGTIPLGPIELFAKAGYYFYDVEFTGSGLADEWDGSDEDFVYGAGLGLTLFGRLHARLEYEIIDISDTSESNAVWLSGAFRF